MSNSLTADANASRILLIDDDAAMLQSVSRMLRTEGFGDALLCNDPLNAHGLLESYPIGVILLDLVMSGVDGETLLETITDKWPEIPVIVLTAKDEVDTAVRCIKTGAFDYLVKPVEFARLFAVMTQAMRQCDLRTENRRLQELIREPKLRNPDIFSPIITRSPAMQAVFRYIEAVASSSEPVLIIGETGVGKELVAQALHRASGRKGPMVAVNVTGIDDNVFADTLFGHVKGAFTGADHDRDGLVERAAGGTLFLDEIGDLGLESQSKLLRLVQEREFMPLGTDSCRRSRCRIVAATNRNLQSRMQTDRFRADLYYRLHGHVIRISPLRERTEDIEPLVNRFLRIAAESLGKPIPTVPKELVTHLAAYRFPGNVRELRAMVTDAVTRHVKGILGLATFLDHMGRAVTTSETVSSQPFCDRCTLALAHNLPTLDEATKTLIAEAMKRSDGNQGAAARLLGVSRRTINRHLCRESNLNRA